MIPNDDALQKQPPDCPMDKKGAFEGGISNIPSTTECKANRDPVLQASKSLNAKEESTKGDMKGKMQQTAKRFTGEVTLKLRVKEWMEDDELSPQPVQLELLSYKEALKLKTSLEK